MLINENTLAMFYPKFRWVHMIWICSPKDTIIQNFLIYHALFLHVVMHILVGPFSGSQKDANGKIMGLV